MKFTDERLGPVIVERLTDYNPSGGLFMAYQPEENYAQVLILQDEAFSISIQHHTVPGIAATPVESNIHISSVEKLEGFLNALGVNAIQKKMEGLSEHSNHFEIVPCTLTQCLNWLTERKNHHSHTVAFVARNVSEEEIKRRLEKWRNQSPV